MTKGKVLQTVLRIMHRTVYWNRFDSSISFALCSLCLTFHGKVNSALHFSQISPHNAQNSCKDRLHSSLIDEIEAKVEK